MGKIIVLTNEERGYILDAIEAAQSRIDEVVTEEDCIRVFNETVAPALWRLLKDHRQERQLS